MKERIRKIKSKIVLTAAMLAISSLHTSAMDRAEDQDHYWLIEPFLNLEGGETEGAGDSEKKDIHFFEVGSKTEMETETESEMGTETESETVIKEREEAFQRSLIRTLATMPEGFRYPMMFPESVVDGNQDAESESVSEKDQDIESENEPETGVEVERVSDVVRAAKETMRELADIMAVSRPKRVTVKKLETESETQSGTETESESEIAASVPFQLYGLRDLSELRQLHGIHPVFLHGEPSIEAMYKERDLKILESIVERQISGYDGEWSVYLKNLNTGQSFVINDKPMKSASVMKLFILGTVYRAFEEGELERTDEIMSWVNNMITYSDNESTNRLLYSLGYSDYKRGIDKVDAFIKEYGFSDMTIEYNGFENADTVFDHEHFNQVSAQDCGKLLEDIYRRNWVSRNASNEIEQMLLKQSTRYKIPAGLPEGVLCGNKTGEMSTTENDAAIIYSDNCDYILVVLSSDWGSKDGAIANIGQISSRIYNFLN